MLYSLQGGDWQERSLDEVASSSGKWTSISFQLKEGSASSEKLLEFVLTNGKMWDKKIDGEMHQPPVAPVLSSIDLMHCFA